MIGSPTAFLLWAILSCIFFGFLIIHLWCYDRFNCLRWDSGRQPGAFKRVMTYSYLTTLPLLVIFSVSITALKFDEGFLQLPQNHILPLPLELWRQGNKKWVVPLYFVLSVGWSLEIVTHLEELAFWLFLLHQGQGQREWFHSWEFRVWYLGSMVSVLGMPLTALVTRNNLETSLAWILLVGSSASTLTTLLFLYVLARFPGFIRTVKIGGAGPDVVVRLVTFYQLNLTRVFFRFLFSIPLLIIGIDGVQGSHMIVLNPFGADFLIMMGGIGCFFSSAITLVIFFPRSISGELGYKPKESAIQTSESGITHHHHHRSASPQFPTHGYVNNNNQNDRAMMASFHFPQSFANENPSDFEATPVHDDPKDTQPATTPHDMTWDPHVVHRTYSYTASAFPHSNRHRQAVVPTPGTPPHLEAGTLPLNIHPYVMNFTSPIDLLDPAEDNLPRAI